MEELFSIVIGVVLIVIGIFNRKGNISLIHSYHRKRVSEENRLPYGKAMGLGIIIDGIAIIIMGALSFLGNILQNSIYSTIGTVFLIVGLVIGLCIAFYAMIKYNKGIF